jgi:valyl-tRNA synthetase
MSDLTAAEKMSASNLDKSYSPKAIEEKWSVENLARLYEANAGNVTSPEAKFTLLMPPPNITGILTMGHVLNHTIQDVFVRYNRLIGKETLWLPGTDHAGIATQTAVEKSLRKEKLTRYDLGREKFIERVWAWREQYGNIILTQLKRLGDSADWRRNKFTLDPDLNEAVTNAFVKLYNDGLIYKGKRIINWCPASQTALSDEEVIMKTQTDKLYFVKYFFADDSSKFITVATVRPETILGDVAIAVNPKDERYKYAVGQFVIEPLTKRHIPIIADDYVEMEFGTGALKITPAHDPNDYEVGLRHNLPIVVAIDKFGKVSDGFGKYSGLDRFEARKLTFDDLQASGNIEKTEDYTHNVGYSERADVVVEPYLSEQWFVKMQPLAEPALKVVEDGLVQFYPERWTNVYRNWLTNIRDWCISRQLWWGHRIPAWYNADGKVFVAKNFDEAAKLAGTKNIVQDEDVLDTWFSSWLWPLTTLGWTGNGSLGSRVGDDNEDLQKFYPTDTLVTGPDIIFFWVARMIMAGLYFRGNRSSQEEQRGSEQQLIPFRKVYFTSIIRDAQGRKMSKSLGNSPDPLDVMNEYGTDALRFTVIYLAPLGQDVLFATEKCELGKNFANKIWNAARFLFMNRNDVFKDKDFDAAYAKPDDLSRLDLADRWIFSRLHTTLAKYHDAQENLRPNEIAKLLYDFIWGDFCDWYVEIMKTKIQNATSQEEKEFAVVRAIKVFELALKMLHPVMPFITEEIWQSITPRKEHESIGKAGLEAAEKNFITEKIEDEFELLKKIIVEVRRVRNALSISPALVSEVWVKGKSQAVTDAVLANKFLLEKLARSTFKADAAFTKPKASAGGVVDGNDVFILLEGLIDLDKEKVRLEKEITKQEGFLKSISAKLANENFVSKAPEAVLQTERDKKSAAELTLQKLKESLESLK